MEDNYLIDRDTIDFLVDSRGQTGDISQLSKLLTAPKDFAKRYSIPISSSVQDRLLKLGKMNKCKGYGPDDSVNKEITTFFNKVLIDGRFIEEWVTAPENVAKQLGIRVTDEAISRIKELELNELVNTNLLIDPKQINQTSVGVVITIVLVVIFVLIPGNATHSLQEIIVDPCQQNKV